ncbi:exo-alpha-sialidase [Rhizobium sp. BK251]|uniref:WD40/YVTN/BNR-like repeat-containing protein n=1 Tax=Rhizobium sp. BK251 TaxID=2512125 RepID=UPI00104657E9|nr:exo-alpha-sialidase [Rhizobium sp. BK251]TCL76246.1 BNR/Asp-box repeat protein [Rhizobium sp. BK251]
MAKKVLILVGTKKGAFILESSAERSDWKLKGPYCATWPINHVVGDPKTGKIYAGGGNEWFGGAVWQSADLGENWTHSSEGLNYESGDTPIKAVWSLAVAHDRVNVGVEPAGLFRSFDGGQTFMHVEGLQKHPSREHWTPGGGGLILHSLVPHPDDPDQLWVGISAAGVFYTADGGKTWETRNRGTRADFLPEGQNYPEFGQCVHCLVMGAGRPDRLYQQNHCGMYRCDDGAKQWESIEEGLPSTFGFPAAAHPRDPDVLYLLPLNSDIGGRFVPEGKTAVWRTRDAGKTWQSLRNGLPQQDVYFNVLRQALATDTMDSAGIYFGTSSGELYASADEGENWQRIAEHLPAVYSVETMVLDG